MANVQKYLEKFHENIRIDYDTSAPLREKRDIILDKIRKYLQENSKPSFKEFIQGSYITKTGVRPIEMLEFDIDIGLRFYIKHTEYSAADVRTWVQNAVKNHTDKVEFKGPCIRVIYQDGYHVDLVVYAVSQDVFGKETYKLAHKDDKWIDADPPGLLSYVSQIMKNFEDSEDALTKTNQFRRLVRYLRRWDDEAISKESSAKPSGLAYVLLVDRIIKGKVFFNGKSDDLSALLQIANAVMANFGRINIRKPTPEYEDLFKKISDGEMTTLKDRFKGLSDAISQVKNEPNEKKACQVLKKQFGRDFPVPEEDRVVESLMGTAFAATSPSFPNKPLVPNKPGLFA